MLSIFSALSGGGPDHGPGPRHHLREREEAEEEADPGLHLLQPQAPQLLGIQILLLRVSRSDKCCR